jgi:hypothetical protein
VPECYGALPDGDEAGGVEWVEADGVDWMGRLLTEAEGAAGADRAQLH